ncbi:radical SAM protein [Candidatus Thiomargarita nelsonii]|uniref:Radical SAM protein n=1 Tax=Candidatus Thiomargarita nelsonii TaxID=1003181 RepID=A0A0A6PB65_9GAMM|nr:radical SAM protein [Candidatus Thiomargarita nelsonii]
MIQQKSTIGLVELPSLGLFNVKGKNMLSNETKNNALVSKQILLSNLQAAGFDAQLIDLRQGNHQEEYGKSIWRNTEYSKVYFGSKIQEIDPLAYDAWGVTNNFSQYREIAYLTIKHLASKGRPVVVGGSDAIAESQSYLAAGATSVVLDKSGAANAPIMDYVLGKTPREELSGVILANGSQPPLRVRRALHPEDWPIPDDSVIKQCLGTQHKNLPLPEERLKIGSIMTDIGCDRHCDFCQTPTYRLGYRAMSPKRVLQWLLAQKKAGAKSVLNFSDQFLGRILKKGGRDDILEIMKSFRELGLAVFWPNGLELKKTTLGRGIIRKNYTDMTPDEDLIEALWGWDGKTGCYMAYIPAERPVFGQENYAKLLPWVEHCQIMKVIARAGVPNIRYGVMIGFEDDSNESLLRLEEAVAELYEDILAINPAVNFQVQSLALIPIPGTPQWDAVRDSGLLRSNDPSIFGGMGTSAVDTRYLSSEQIADWQVRLAKIGAPYIL